MRSGAAAIAVEPLVDAAPAATGPLSVEIRPAREIPLAWQRAWDALADQPSEPNVFAERWFVNAGIRHLLPGGETWIVSVWRGGDDLIGLLPVRIERRYGRTPVAHVENWAHHQCFLGTPLIRRGEEAPFWREVLVALDGARWARGFFHMTGLVEGGPVHLGLADAAASLGRPCAVVHRSSRALLASNLSPRAYYEQAVRKKKRKELGRLSARLGERGELTVTRAGSAAEAARVTVTSPSSPRRAESRPSSLRFFLRTACS